MEIIINGCLSGLVLALLIGPVFFSLIQTSLESGFISGIWVAIGISLSDTLYILLCYFGLSQILGLEKVRIYMAIIGGLILVTFGIYYIFFKIKRVQVYVVQKTPNKSPWRLVLKGFIINAVNPSVLFFWVGVVGIATTDLGYHQPTSALAYFSSMVGTVFTTDLLKAKLSDRLRNSLTPTVIKGINLVVGVTLLVYGGRLIFSSNTF